MSAAHGFVTIRGAAELAGCDPSTIKRDLLDGRYPGATRDGDDRNRTWQIPVRDLVLAGRYRPPVGGADSTAVAAQALELAQARADLRREQDAHGATSARLAAAEAALDAERRHAQILERLVEKALSAPAAVA